MARITVKSSTVFVSVDDETRVFRSIDEVPPEWRRRFERPKGGLKPQTILIADRKGKEEIMRSLQGRPSGVTTRWKSSPNQAASPASPSDTAKAKSARTASSPDPQGAGRHSFKQQLCIELGFVVILAGLIYASFAN